MKKRFISLILAGLTAALALTLLAMTVFAGNTKEEQENRFPYENISASTLVHGYYIAPGVIQQEKTCTSDGATIRYFLSVADIRRDDVGIFVNAVGKNSSGNWQSATITSQFNTFQSKHSSCRAVVATNANMCPVKVDASTGLDGAGKPLYEPRGLVVADGQTVFAYRTTHDRNYDFFAILKDGTAVVGRYEDYAKYQDQIQ